MKKVLFCILCAVTALVACNKGNEEVLVKQMAIKAAGNTTTIKVGGTVQLTVNVVPTAATNKSVDWSSSAPAVASVDANGVVKGESKGTTTILAKAKDGSGVTATLDITVVPDAVLVTKITLSETSFSLPVGGEKDIEAVVEPDGATDKSVEWISDKTSVVTVTGGKVKAVGSGEAKVTAKAKDGSGVVSNACVVTVTEPKPIIVKFQNMTIRVGQNYNNNVWYGSYAEYADREDFDAPLAKSSNESVVTVTASAGAVSITGVAPGEATVTVSDAAGSKFEIPVKVVAAAVQDYDANYGIELLDAHKVDTWKTHGDVELGEGYEGGPQCVHNKKFYRSEAGKIAYTLFEAKFPNVDISGIKNPALYVRFYVNDVTLLSLNGSESQIELTSSGDMDQEEYTWVGGRICKNWPGEHSECKNVLKNGWNNLVLPISYAEGGNGFRPKKVSYFRMYNNPATTLEGSGVEVAIDQLRVVDWTEFDTVDKLDADKDVLCDRWFDGGTGNNRPCYFYEDSFDGHTGVFGSKDELITGPISNFRLKEWGRRVYAVPVNMDESNTLFSWDFWVDDADWFNKCDIRVELSSENVNDNHSLSWSFVPGDAHMVKGWNSFTHDMSEKTFISGGDASQWTVRKINYFRIVVTPMDGATPSVHTYRIDNLRFSKK